MEGNGTDLIRDLPNSQRVSVLPDWDLKRGLEEPHWCRALVRDTGVDIEDIAFELKAEERRS